MLAEAQAAIAVDADLRRRLRSDGYVHLSRVVDEDLVESAKFVINHDLATSGIDPTMVSRYQHSSWCPSVRNHESVLALLRKSPVRLLLEEVLGPGRVRSVTTSQIALRFPERVAGDGYWWPHVDGLNAELTGRPRTFTALVAIHLSAVRTADSGNFVVWPGTHVLNSEQFRSSGLLGFPQGRSQVGVTQTTPILAEPGDVTIAHYLLGHSPSPNLSSDVRYVVFFRVRTEDLDSNVEEALSNPWFDWPLL
jgi:hypothetical protein